MGAIILPTAGTMPDDMATPLAERHCVPCEKGTPPLPRAVAQDLLGQLPGWAIETAGDHLRLTRTVRFKGFLPGVELIDRIAQVAETEGHHPDLVLSYGSLVIQLWTHTAGGLTVNDFVLAAKIDRALPPH
jgi:4a-hydroxytetrahydrobiopterin dehydratase